MDYLAWRNRITNRTDMAARITHLTKGSNDEKAFDSLWKILVEKRLIGSGKGGFVVGTERAVCFQEVPLAGIAENLAYEDEMSDRLRYSWFGLRFNKIRMYEAGARPVIYGKTEDLKAILSSIEFWRIVNLNLDRTSIIDWSHEREWRIKGDYLFEYDDIEILVKDDHYYRKLIEKCIDEERTDIILQSHGIVSLNSILS